MPLSSVIGSSSIMQPGVCTSSTRPASPYDGQVIYETDTDKTLVWNGTGWVFLSTSRANPVGLDLIKSQTIGTAVSSVTVSDAFSSTYDNYRIIISGGVGSADTPINLTLGSTTTGYYRSGGYNVYSSGTVVGFASSNAASFLEAMSGSANAISGAVDVYSPNLARNTVFSATNASAGTARYALFIGGYLADTTQYTAFTLTVGTGTMTGGTIAVYGYAK